MLFGKQFINLNISIANVDLTESIIPILFLVGGALLGFGWVIAEELTKRKKLKEAEKLKRERIKQLNHSHTDSNIASVDDMKMKKIDISKTEKEAKPEPVVFDPAPDTMSPSFMNDYAKPNENVSGSVNVQPTQPVGQTPVARPVNVQPTQPVGQTPIVRPVNVQPTQPVGQTPVVRPVNVQPTQPVGQTPVARPVNVQPTQPVNNVVNSAIVAPGVIASGQVVNNQDNVNVENDFENIQDLVKKKKEEIENQRRDELRKIEEAKQKEQKTQDDEKKKVTSEDIIKKLREDNILKNELMDKAKAEKTNEEKKDEAKNYPQNEIKKENVNNVIKDNADKELEEKQKEKERLNAELERKKKELQELENKRKEIEALKEKAKANENKSEKENVELKEEEKNNTSSALTYEAGKKISLSDIQSEKIEIESKPDKKEENEKTNENIKETEVKIKEKIDKKDDNKSEELKEIKKEQEDISDTNKKEILKDKKESNETQEQKKEKEVLDQIQNLFSAISEDDIIEETAKKHNETKQMKKEEKIIKEKAVESKNVNQEAKKVEVKKEEKIEKELQKPKELKEAKENNIAQNAINENNYGNIKRNNNENVQNILKNIDDMQIKEARIVTSTSIRKIADYRKIIAIISPENCGKTTVAVNLAYELANRGISTTLIDTDNVKKDVYYYINKEHIGCLSRLNEFDTNEELYNLGIKLRENLTIFTENKGVEFEINYAKLYKIIEYAHEKDEAVIIDIKAGLGQEKVKELLKMSNSILLVLDKRITSLNRIAMNFSKIKGGFLNKEVNAIINMDVGQRGVNKSVIKGMLRKLEYYDNGQRKTYGIDVKEMFFIAYDTRAIMLGLLDQLPAITVKDNKIIGDIKKIALYYFDR